MNLRLRFVPLDEHHVDDCANLMARRFCAADPMQLARRMDPVRGFLPFAKTICQRAAGTGLSTVCFVEDEVAAVCLSEDAFDPLVPNSDPFFASPEFLTDQWFPVFDLLEQMTNSYHHSLADEWKRPALWFHQYIVAVSEPYLRRGLCRAILQENLRTGTERGFRRAIIECTGSYSQAAAKKLGYETVRTTKYDDFVCSNGERPFAQVSSTTDHDACLVMTMDLGGETPQ